MNEFCTCGARLPEDARFCHKCGKPQREEPEIDALQTEASPETPEPPPLPIAIAPAPPGIGFRNPAAVRAALLSSALATLAGILPLPGLFHLLWQLLSIVAGGFASVYLYQRRTGNYLSLRGGLQLGWMTGLFCFIVVMVMLTIVLAAVSGMGEEGLKKLATDSGKPEVASTLGTMLSDPPMLIFALVSLFFFMTMLGTAGGALGSKVLERE